MGGVERRPSVERRQVRNELGRGLALLAGEDAEAREEIVIGKTRSESEDVHAHAACCITADFASAVGPWRAAGKIAAAVRVTRRQPRARNAPTGAGAFQERS